MNCWALIHCMNVSYVVGHKWGNSLLFQCIMRMLIILYHVRFEVSTAVTMMIIIFWEMTPCGSYKNRSVTCSHSCTLKMEAIRSSETSVLIRATPCHLPEDDNHNIVPCLGAWDTQFGLLIHFITILTTITYNTVTYFHLNSLKYTAGYSSVNSLQELSENWLLTNWMLPHSLRNWTVSGDGLQDNTSARTPKKKSPCCRVIRSNVFNWSLPRNGFRNTAVLLLRDLATDCLPRISLSSDEI
jgi:hypothetical protein